MSSRRSPPRWAMRSLPAPADLNDGYPILRWQVPTYTVTFTVDPAGAEVTIDGQTGTHTEGRWVFALPDGTYSYSVRAFGYLEKTGELTVQGGTGGRERHARRRGRAGASRSRSPRRTRTPP